MSKHRIMLCTEEGCPLCDNLRKWLSEKSIQYVERHIGDSKIIELDDQQLKELPIFKDETEGTE